jgi:hypothetical protein
MQGKNDLLLSRSFRHMYRQCASVRFAQLSHVTKLQATAASTKRVIMAMKKRGLLSGFNKWRRVCSNGDRLKVAFYVMRKVCSSLLMRSLSKYVRTWRFKVLQLVQSEREAAHREALVYARVDAKQFAENRAIELKYFKQWQRMVDPLVVTPAQRYISPVFFFNFFIKLVK